MIVIFSRHLALIFVPFSRQFTDSYVQLFRKASANNRNQAEVNFERSGLKGFFSIHFINLFHNISIYNLPEYDD